MMRKKKYLWIILATFQVWIFSTCSDALESPPESEIPEGAITVEEAKACFEEQIMRIGSVIDKKSLKGWATNFTPQWEGAVINGCDGKLAVDVPILADYTFKVFIPGEGGIEDKKLFQEKLMQKLIVVKDLQTGILCSYVVSIIPDSDYARSKKRKLSAMDFTNYGDYGHFSGWVIYSFPLSPVPLWVNYYQNGKQMDAAGVFGLYDELEVQVAGAKMKEMLEGFRLKRESRVALRVWEILGPEVEIIGNYSGGWTLWDDYFYIWSYLNGLGNGTELPPPNPGGGGGNPLGADLSTIANKHSLAADQIYILYQIADELWNECGYQFMQTYITDAQFKFNDIRIDPTLLSPDEAGYDPVTGNLLFYSAGEMNPDYFREEFVHLYQDSHYAGGIAQYTNTGKSNIEFEAKLMIDILCVLKGTACPALGATPANGTDYLTWIDAITNLYTALPSYSDLFVKQSNWGNKDYWDFLDDFKNDPSRPSYNKPIDYDLFPDALLGLNNSDCY